MQPPRVTITGRGRPAGQKHAQPTWTVLLVLIGFVFVVIPALVGFTPVWGRIAFQALGVLTLLFALVYPLLEAIEPPAPAPPERIVRRFGGEEPQAPERPERPSGGSVSSEHEEPHSRPRPRVVSRRSH